MSGILQGIRVVELASFVFVPAAGGILADWGAEVLKVEHPRHGDPYRTPVAGPAAGENPTFVQANRGKKSVAIDVATADGREALLRLVETADVFLTNWLGSTRRRFRLDVDDLRARKPRIIYVRGTGFGAKGDEADRRGFDATAYWYRGGLADALSPDDAEWPIGQRPGIGDWPGGAIIAGGVTGALFARERTGQGQVVDVSLLGCATWTLNPDILAAKANPASRRALIGRGAPNNPLAFVYKTRDRRVISLVMLESDRYWDDFCRHIDRVDLIADPRFGDAGCRARNAGELVGILDGEFGRRTLAEWRTRLGAMKGAWDVVQAAGEVAEDPQVRANDYVKPMAGAAAPAWLASAPVQFNETAPELRRPPGLGEHTDDVLASIGYAPATLAEMRASGVIG
jgi:crotonobetainyl-CoA:carnitine CoA-transferase CaiB-like acyl-CoA transferase